MPKLSICFATHTDFDGIYFSIQDLRIRYPELMKDTEFVICDNSPQTKHSEMIRGLIGQMAPYVAGVQYFEMADKVGTSPSRNKLFEMATGEIVLVMDSHVLLKQGALESLLAYYDAHPGCMDLLSGPIVYDNLVHTASHFNPIWRAQMYGTWGSAWQCNCDRRNGTRFSVVGITETGNVHAFTLDMAMLPVSECAQCGSKLPTHPSMPELKWHGHETAFYNLSFHKIGEFPDDVPFEIPAQGLGLFSCRKEAWLGFNKDALGFGGEEVCIHELYRQAGRKSICIPKLIWMHRFGRAHGTPYAVSLHAKVRNYVLWFNQLSWDLTPVKEHFVKGSTPNPTQEQSTYQTLGSVDWDKLILDPVGYNGDAPAACGSCGASANVAIAAQFKSFDEVFETIKAIPRDLNEHMDEFKRLGSLSPRIVEFSGRKESLIGFLAGKPETMLSYNPEQDPIAMAARALSSGVTKVTSVPNGDSAGVPVIPETDLLFLDTEHTYARLTEELRKYAGAVKRFIVVHDTTIFGHSSQDKGPPGLLQAIREFCLASPQWSVISHTDKQYGLTVIGCDQRDKPQPPPLIALQTLKHGWTDLKKMIAGGFEGVPEEEFRARLDVCALCPMRNGDRCTDCGCFVEARASQRTMDCPYKKWPGEADYAGPVVAAPEPVQDQPGSEASANPVV